MVSLTTAQFARNLRRELDRAGMTQADLARAAGMHRAQVNHYATGSARPSLPTLLRLLEALGCTVGDLLETQP